MGSHLRSPGPPLREQGSPPLCSFVEAHLELSQLLRPQKSNVDRQTSRKSSHQHPQKDFLEYRQQNELIDVTVSKLPGLHGWVRGKKQRVDRWLMVVFKS